MTARPCRHHATGAGGAPEEAGPGVLGRSRGMGKCGLTRPSGRGWWG